MYYILNIERTQCYNHLWWWKSNKVGYTPDLAEAGQYQLAQLREVVVEGEDIAIQCSTFEVDGITRLTRAENLEQLG